MQKTNVLSFKNLKQQISLEQVLRHYNLFDTLQLRGKSHRGPCPFCEATEGNPFSVSLEKNCYQCFTCKASGNILDFVSRWKGVSIREAGQVLAKNLVGEKEPPTVAQTVEKTTEREAPLAEGADPPIRSADGGEAGYHTNQVGVVARERTDKETNTQAPTVNPPQGEILSRNEPLTFALKNVEPDHPSVKALGMQEDILTAFGVGYYSGKGIMANHIVIPIYNLSRQLVGYAGFHPGDRTYTYPPKFRQELEVYNLGGALADNGADQGLILVQHPLEVLTLISAGFTNSAALMMETMSTEQVEALLAMYGAGERVTLVWPIHADIIPTLSALLPLFFVRLRRYEEKCDIPSGFTTEDAQELLA